MWYSDGMAAARHACGAKNRLLYGGSWSVPNNTHYFSLQIVSGSLPEGCLVSVRTTSGASLAADPSLGSAKAAWAENVACLQPIA